MYNSKNRQYLFRLSSNRILNIFYDDKRGLCYSYLSNKNTWFAPIVLKNDVLPTFYADLDREDRIHIVFQDKLGNIYYSKIGDAGVKTVLMLTSKHQSSYDKHLFLIPLENTLHLLYVLNHNNSAILAHQVMNNGNVNTPKVIDYVSHQNRTYSVSMDKTGNTYIFYQISDGKQLQLGYKKYISTQKTWGEYMPLTRHNGNCSYPNAITDSSDILHLCYQRQNEKRYNLVYQQKIPDKNIWTPEVIIHNSMYPFEDSSVISLNETITIFWVRDDIIYYSSSKDCGSSWSKATRYYFSSCRPLLCLCFKSNFSNEGGKVITPCIPGNLAHGIKLAFHTELHNYISNNSKDIEKNTAKDETYLLKEEIRALKESKNILKDEIAKIEYMYQALAKEIIKYSVKLGLLENELAMKKLNEDRVAANETNIYQINLRMNDLSEELHSFKSKSEEINLAINEVLNGHSIEIEKLYEEISKIVSKE